MQHEIYSADSRRGGSNVERIEAQSQQVPTFEHQDLMQPSNEAVYYALAWMMTEEASGKPAVVGLVSRISEYMMATNRNGSCRISEGGALTHRERIGSYTCWSGPNSPDGTSRSSFFLQSLAHATADVARYVGIRMSWQHIDNQQEIYIDQLEKQRDISTEIGKQPYPDALRAELDDIRNQLAARRLDIKVLQQRELDVVVHSSACLILSANPDISWQYPLQRYSISVTLPELF